MKPPRYGGAQIGAISKMSEVPGPSSGVEGAAWGARIGRLLPDLAAVVVALVPAFIGIGWGLPSRGRFEQASGGDLEGAIREVLTRHALDEPRKAAGLVFEPLDPDLPDTPGRVLRRFALYSDHPDEMLVLSALSRMRPQEFALDPGAYHYGGLFIYPIGVLIWLAGTLGLVELTTDVTVYLRDPGQIARFYLIGRFYVVCLHGVSLYALLVLAKRRLSKKSAYLALAFYAIFPSTIVFSHEMKPHLGGVAFSLLTVLVMFSSEGLRYTKALGSGALAGCAASMTPTYALVVLFLPTKLLADRSARKGWVLSAACFLGAAAAVYALFNPYVVAHPSRMLAEMHYGKAMYPIAPSLLGPISFVKYLPDALTWPGAIAAIVSTAWISFAGKTDQTTRALVVPVGAYFVIVSVFTSGSSAGPVNARFGCFMYPFLALFVACAIEGCLRQVYARTLAGGVLIASLVLGSAPYIWAFARSAGASGTREEAGAYLAQCVPVSSEIGIRGRLAPWNSPRLELGKWRWLDLEREPSAKPRWLLVLGRDGPPEAYELAARFEPFGFVLFGRPERMGFACPVFSVYLRREGL